MVKTKGEKDLISHFRLLHESKENAHLSAFIEAFGDEARTLIEKTNYQHGWKNGKKALKRFRPTKTDAPTVSSILVEWVVGGLEEARGLKQLTSTPEKVEYQAPGCAHMGAWKDAGMDTDLGCSLYKSWVDGFCHAINPKINHYKTSRISAGDPYCVEIFEITDEDQTMAVKQKGGEK